MKVCELKELLANADDNDVVVIARDAEGNGYSPLYGSWKAIYVPESSWSGNVYMRSLTEKDIKAGFTKEDLYDGDDGVFALVLTPTN